MIGDRDVTDVAPKKRDIAMVFQNYALYPYLTVAANIAFPLKIAKVTKAERERAFARSRQLLGLTEYLSASRGSCRAASASAWRWAGDRPPAERLPDGRAALEPRRQAPRPDAGRHRRAPGAARHDDGLRHARPGRGHDARPPGRRAEGRAAAAVRRPARALRPPRELVRGGIHRLAGDEPLHRSLRRERRRLAGGTVVAVSPAAGQAAAACGIPESWSASAPRRSTSRATASPPRSRWSRSSAPTPTSSASPSSPGARRSWSPASRRRRPERGARVWLRPRASEALLFHPVTGDRLG